MKQLVFFVLIRPEYIALKQLVLDVHHNKEVKM